MNILALDMATKTGWSWIVSGKVKESGVQDFTKRRGESNGVLFLRFRKWLSDTCALVKPDLIAYEQAHMRGGDAGFGGSSLELGGGGSKGGGAVDMISNPLAAVMGTRR